MVSGLSIALMAITLLIVFVFPIGLWIYFYKREKISGIAVLVGALTFFVSQIVLRIPLLQLLQSQSFYAVIGKNIWLNSLFLSLTAGIFEEMGRFLSFKFLLKNKLQWKNGIAFGIGHGGIEAIMLTGLTYLNNLIFSLMINSGAFEQISGTMSPEMSNYIISGLTGTNSFMFLVAGMERVFAIIAHIAFSMIVLYGVKYRKNIYVVFAILAHTLLNAPSVILSHYFGLWGEVYVLLFAVLSIVIIKRFRAALRDSLEF